MSDAGPAPGTRAITIPLHRSNDTLTSNRRPASRRPLNLLNRTTSSEADSSSPSSYQASSSWSSTFSRTTDKTTSHQFQSIASPSTKDPHLPGSSNNSSSKDKGKQKPPTTPPPASPTSYLPSPSPLGPTMLASSSYKSVNLNAHNDDPDEPARLITYTKHSQGFTWNDELFLPSYLIGRYGKRRRRHGDDWGDGMDDDDGGDMEGGAEVVEVFVSDEEAANMWP